MSAQIFLLLGTEIGVFMGTSDVSRQSWKFKGPWLDYPVYTCVADTRADPPVLYAGVNSAHFGPMVRYSRDLGKTWREAMRNPKLGGARGSVEAIWQIQPDHPSRPESLYAGISPAALFHSPDRGETWNEMKELSNHESRPNWRPCKGGLCLHSILVDPGNPDHLWVGISAVGVFESRNKREWILANQALESNFRPGERGGLTTCVHKLAYAAGSSGRIYAQNHLGVWRRDPGVEAWKSIDQDLPSRFGFTILAHPKDESRAYVIPLQSQEMRMPHAGQLSVYATRDGGSSWRRLHRGLPVSAYVKVLRDALAADDADPPGLYFGTTGGHLFSSADGGENWFEVAAYLPKIYSVRAFVC